MTSVSQSSTFSHPQLKQDKVLVVDDDPEIRSLLTDYLAQNGFEVEQAANGNEMDLLLKSFGPDIVLLDIMMPGRDGMEICRDLRATSWLPIIMLTAKNTDIDRILGIEVGADDYMTKPFNPRELLARIKSVLRRARAPVPKSDLIKPNEAKPADADTPGVFTFNSWVLDTNACRLFNPSGADIELTSGEFDLLNAFVLSAGRAVTRAHLLQLTHGVLSESYERSIDVLVSRLRTKLRQDEIGNLPEKENKSGQEIIKTVRNVGYLFTPTVTGKPA